METEVMTNPLNIYPQPLNIIEISETSPTLVEINPQPINIIEITTEPLLVKGDTGLSAYELAVVNGFTGTLQEWLDSLRVELEWSSTNW